MSIRIVLKYTVGERETTLHIDQPTGASGVLHVTMDNFHHGQLVRRNGKWYGYFGNHSPLTQDDVDIMSEEIEKYLEDNNISL